MIHTFKALGCCIAMDVDSGAVHVLDELSYDLLNCVTPPMAEHCPEDVIEKLSQYPRAELEECWQELKELAEEKLLFEEEPQRLRQLEEAIRAQDWSREYEVVASAVNLLEITARGANKGGMVRRLAELLGVRQENVCCVGDHANDIPMLEYAGMAFAPENAIPAVHRVPGIRILPDCRENAMAAMIAVLDRRYS